MSDDPIRTVRLDETHRVTIYYDESPENPRTNEGMVTGALTVRGDSRRIDVEPIFELHNLREADERLFGITSDGWGNDEIAVIRWARIFHDTELSYVNGTYWWVSPYQLTGWTPAGERDGVPLYRYGAGPELLTRAELALKLIESDQEVYQQWADGEVYGLAVEEFRLTAPIGLDEDGELILLRDQLEDVDIDDCWTHVDTVWGYYLDPWDDLDVASNAKGMY